MKIDVSVNKVTFFADPASSALCRRANDDVLLPAGDGGRAGVFERLSVGFAQQIARALPPPNAL